MTHRFRTGLDRRELLRRGGMGMAAVAVDGVLGAASAAGATERPSGPHFAPRARRVIHVFANGGPSHIDTFDPKPMLARHAGEPLPGGNPKTERKTGGVMPSPFRFRRHGESGLWVSELFPHVARSADRLCVIRSMHADVPNHEPSLMLMNTGAARLIRPSLGSWTVWGLGSENRNLPGFVVLCPGGYPIQESQNWQSAFLPGALQGVHVDTRHVDPRRLIPHIDCLHATREEQRRQLDLLRELDAAHAAARADDARLEARLESFELAFRMQIEATDAFDVGREPEHARRLYGGGVQGRQLLIARRLLERGVRFVQVWHGAGQPWDSHDDLERNHRRLAGECDRAIGALLIDLQQRGMLDDTLVIWGGEFGRTPTVELPSPGNNAGRRNGRDHDHHGFTMWLAGGGVRGGHAHGATDEFGFAATESPVHVHDLHATILHLLGFDHERLTYRHAGRDFRLTDVHGRVVRDLLA